MSGVGPLMGDISWMALKSNGFVIELGIFNGQGSTVAIQDGLKYHSNPLHISVDWDDKNLVVHGKAPDWWWIIWQDTRSRDALGSAKAVALGRKAGLIFIDTLHDYDQMKAELELWQEMADDKTVWIGHDSWMYGVKNEPMVKAVEEFAAANGWRYEDYRQDSHGLWRMTR